MNALHALDRQTQIVHIICYSNLSPRRLGQEYSPEVLLVRIDPSSGIIEAICTDTIVRFEVPVDRDSRNLVIQNVLVDLGFYPVTSAVPDKLTDSTNPLTYILEWEKLATDITAVNKTRPPVMRVTD